MEATLATPPARTGLEAKVAWLQAKLQNMQGDAQCLIARLEHAEHLQVLFQQAPGFVAVLQGPDHVFELTNAAFTKLVSREVVGRPARAALPDLEGQGYFELLDQVHTTGLPFLARRRRVKLQRDSGPPAEHFIDFVFQPVTQNGAVTGIFVQGSDVTDHVMAERRVAFQARLLDAVERAVIATDLSGIVVYWNRFAEVLYGWRADEAVGRSVLELTVAPERRDEAQEIMARLQAGETWSGEIILQKRDGSTFPASISDAPVYDEAGELIGIVGVSFDNTQQREAEQAQALLVRELHHRVKNTLATVQAIMSSTARGSASMADFQAAFSSRIASLARTHELLANDQWQEVTFRELLEAELEPYTDRAHNRVVLDGPELMLPSQLAVPLGMAIHELTTNAVKYGAFSERGGQIEVRWTVTDDGGVSSLRWDWRERDGPRVTVPTAEGFGSRLLRLVLTAQVQAEIKVDFDPDGLRVLARVPLPYPAERGLLGPPRV